MPAILLVFGLCLPLYLTAVLMLYGMKPSVGTFLFIMIGEGSVLACWFGLRKRKPQAQPPQLEVRSEPSCTQARAQSVGRVANWQTQRSSEDRRPAPAETRPVVFDSFTTIDEVMRREG